MVSFIIVHYHVKEELFACIESILISKSKTTFEIIVVDNDEEKTIASELHNRFPKVIYVANENKGFGQGNNIGAKKAKGKYLFFLNPDTIVDAHTLDLLTDYLNKNKDVDIVAPLLYDKEKKLISLQGSRELTPVHAFFSLSFINKLFPNNPIARQYWLLDEWNKKVPHEVSSVPGTAFVVRRELFEKVNGFDERFFMYFEEHDFCKRVQELRGKLVMLPQAKIYHSLGSSARKSNRDMEKIFMESRFYYFKKHFGFLKAFLTEALLRFNKYTFLLIITFGIGAFLRFSHLSEAMPFIGDQGWFYLSARDMLLTGKIPQIGRASSHPWLHQGPLWTYLVAICFWLFHFNPIVPAYLSVILDLIAIILLYKLCLLMFSSRVGIIASALYATSPLIILTARMPYHTSPIPFVTIIFLYCFYKVISGHKYVFPLVIFFLALLYNFEIATILLGVFTGIILLYGLITRESWIYSIFDKRILVISIIAFVIPMLPMIIYDFSHGFPQTVGFLVWLGYKMLISFGFPVIHSSFQASIASMIDFFKQQSILLFSPFNEILALFFLILSGVILIKNILQKKAINLLIIFLLNILLIGGLIVSRIPSGAYFPMIFPGL